MRRQDWLLAFHSNDAPQIPKDLKWETDGSTIASCFDGYSLAKSMGTTVAAIHRELYSSKSIESESLQRIICAMFFAFRSDHFSMMPANVGVGRESEDKFNDCLCEMFAEKFHQIDPDVYKSIKRHLMKL